MHDVIIEANRFPVVTLTSISTFLHPSLQNRSPFSIIAKTMREVGISSSNPCPFTKENCKQADAVPDEANSCLHIPEIGVRSLSGTSDSGQALLSREKWPTSDPGIGLGQRKFWPSSGVWGVPVLKNSIRLRLRLDATLRLTGFWLLMDQTQIRHGCRVAWKERQSGYVDHVIAQCGRFGRSATWA